MIGRIIRGFLALAAIALLFAPSLLMKPLSLLTGSAPSGAEPWRKTAPLIARSGPYNVYFYTSSEWAGDWIPHVALSHNGQTIHTYDLSINSVSKSTPTPLWLEQHAYNENTLWLETSGGYYALSLSPEKLAYKKHGHEAAAPFSLEKKKLAHPRMLPDTQRLGVIKEKTQGCCWDFIPAAEENAPPASQALHRNADKPSPDSASAVLPAPSHPLPRSD